MGDLANGVTLVALFSLNVQVLMDSINDDGIQVRLCALAEELSCHAILPYTFGGLKWYQAASASHKDYMREPLHIHLTIVARVGLQASTYKDMISCKSLWPQEGCLKWSFLYSSANIFRRRSQTPLRPQQITDRALALVDPRLLRSLTAGARN